MRLVTWTDRIDKVLTHRIWGTFIFLAVMFCVFQAIFQIADPFRIWIDAGKDKLVDLVNALLEPGPWRSLLADGILKGVGSVVVFVPQIVILFAVIALLEDCGYMARAAFLMDRLMSRAGLNGKSFIPLLSSMACAVPGIMSARVIENPRDRLATILVAPLMSCSARLPVYSLLIGAFLQGPGMPWWLAGLAFFCLYLLGIILAPAIAFLLKRTLLRGETPVFVMEMPLYKMPSPWAVTRRAVDAGWMFLKRAGTMIAASMILVWAALYFPSGNYEATIADLERQQKDLHDQLANLRMTPAEIDAAKQQIETATQKRDQRASAAEWKRRGASLARSDAPSSRPPSRSAGTGASPWRPSPASPPAKSWSARSASSSAKGRGMPATKNIATPSANRCATRTGPIGPMNAFFPCPSRCR